MGGKRTRHARGSVILDKRASGDHVWYFRWTDEKGKRRGEPFATVKDFRTRSQALGEAERLRLREKFLGAKQSARGGVKNFGELVQEYRKEEMPQRYSTKHAYDSWIDKHINPQWEKILITDVEPAPVQSWLDKLQLAPKSKGHIKGLMVIFFNYAMKLKWIPFERNPMDLVSIKGGTKRKRRPKLLTPHQLKHLMSKIEERPVSVIVVVLMCLGLRFSEVLGLQWGDVDWKNLMIEIKRAIVQGHVDQTKTEYSEAKIPMDPALAEVLLEWRREMQFIADTDWIFASPFAGGQQPFFPTGIRRKIYVAAKAAGLDGLLKGEPTKILRHSYRSWLGETDTPLGVIKDLMRHADIRTTMNEYGNGAEEPMRKANSKVVNLVLGKPVGAGK